MEYERIPWHPIKLDAWVVQAREFFRWQVRSKLPTLAPQGVVAETAGERALGAQHFAVQVVALDVTDQLAVEVELVQVAAAVVQKTTSNRKNE